MPNPPNRPRPLRPNAGGAAPRRKGIRAEREIVERLRAAGIPAERVPLSGAAGGRFAGDVIVDGSLVAQVKVRRRITGLATLYRLVGRDPDPEPVTVDPTADGMGTVRRWIGEHDLLFAKADWRPWLAVEWRGGVLAVWLLDGWIANWHARTGRRRAGEAQAA